MIANAASWDPARACAQSCHEHQEQQQQQQAVMHRCNDDEQTPFTDCTAIVVARVFWGVFLGGRVVSPAPLGPAILFWD